MQMMIALTADGTLELTEHTFASGLQTRFAEVHHLEQLFAIEQTDEHLHAIAHAWEAIFTYSSNALAGTTNLAEQESIIQQLVELFDAQIDSRQNDYRLRIVLGRLRSQLHAGAHIDCECTTTCGRIQSILDSRPQFDVVYAEEDRFLARARALLDIGYEHEYRLHEATGDCLQAVQIALQNIELETPVPPSVSAHIEQTILALNKTGEATLVLNADDRKWIEFLENVQRAILADFPTTGDVENWSYSVALDEQQVVQLAAWSRGFIDRVKELAVQFPEKKY